MKKPLTIITLLIFSLSVSGQSCLPEGIIFSTQAQINSFQVNYPGCTEIEGFVRIFQSSIDNLDSLMVLNSIGGYLEIFNNDYLLNLSGLENLTYIGGNIYVEDNLLISSLDCFENITSLQGRLKIMGNSSLTSLSGLDNLAYTMGDLQIIMNDALVSLAGLENLDSIGGSLYISGNPALASLSGIDNIITIKEDLFIEYNTSLNDCHVFSVCNYLDAPNGSINIRGNSTGCHNPAEVADSCNIELGCLPFGNYYFLSQADIDDFQIKYPGCTDLEGDVMIWSSSVSNLTGINVITSVGGDLVLEGNDSLTSLLELINLNAVGNSLKIKHNESLTSLAGLDNIDGGGIKNLQIYGNSLLSECALQSICDYLADPNGFVDIYNNYPGCDSRDEVEEACETLVIDEAKSVAECCVLPNPFSVNTTFEYKLNESSTVEINIFNFQGQLIKNFKKEQSKGTQQVRWNAEGLPAGIYYYRLQAGDMIGGGKMVKVSD